MAYDAVVLAGGVARRFGGVDKPGLTVGGRPLVERVVAAVPDARLVVVVGPERSMPGVRFVREDPPGGGPIPALRAGLAEVSAEWVALLAADLPFLRPSQLTTLRTEAETWSHSFCDTSAPGGAVLVDDDGREQWLVGVWRTERLAAALAVYEGRSLRGLLGPLAPVRVAMAGRPWFDCDTEDDLEEAHMNVLAEWTKLACEELGIDPAKVDRDAILDLTKDVAHGVARPAAPLTAYLLGLAQGAGTAPDDAISRLTSLAANWEKNLTEG